MKFILYTFLFLISINLIGQPTVGSAAIVTIGEDEPTTFLAFEESNWDSGTHGPNQVWDYSALSGGEECNYIAVDPMDTPYYDSFPDSDIYFLCAFSDSQGFTTEQHTYYNVEGNILQLAGNVSISLTNPSFDSIFIVYTDPIDWATFPYSYEDTTEDTFQARVTSYIGDQTILAIQNGTSTHEVDSYGTLTTPSGTFENTLRVKRTELAENSIPGIPITSPQESYRYTWYAENENGVILNLDSIVIKDFTGTIINTNLTGSYRTMGPTSTSTIQSLESDIHIYPNPSLDEINVEFSNISDYKLYIYTINGEELPYSILGSTINSTRIRMMETGIAKGTYFITMIHKENDAKISKTIVLK